MGNIPLEHNQIKKIRYFCVDVFVCVRTRMCASMVITY